LTIGFNIDFFMTKKKNKSLAISLKKVSKTYELHHEKPTFAEQILMRKEKEFFTALQSIDLSIYKGEKIGIIGKNGAGKTTLLKVIAGITTPNKGSVTTHGRVGSLIDLGAGFHPDLTGKDNVFLNGLLLGMSKQEVQQKYQSIVEFSGIGNFIDTPFYTYSTGMKLRLGFSVAVHADPDILILDEGINTGDEDFKHKALTKIGEFLKQKKTILIVSHWLEFLEENVNTFIWLEKGKVKMRGNKKVIEKYRQSF
jgi:lipopolysaccharide transport system ATP-binding protein